MDGRSVESTAESDRPFDPAREPAGHSVRRVVQDVLSQLQAYEVHAGLRQRRRRPADQLAFERTVSAIVSDLIHRELTVPGAWVAIPLSKRRLGGRHKARAHALNTMLPRILAQLSTPEMAFIELRKGYRSPFGPGRQTVIRSGPRLLRRIEDYEVQLGDVGRDSSVMIDPLVLREQKSKGRPGRRCEIPDNDVTRRYRAEMDTVNTWIAQADLSCHCIGPDGREITDDDRYLKRIFNNGSLESGGRLFGGFWQKLDKKRRLSEVVIEGEPPVALDFGQMAPRIAYGLVGVVPPTGDLYCVPPFERNRSGIKPVLNALLASNTWPRRFPMGTRSGFPKHVSIEDVLGAIRAAHPALVPLFGTSVCHRIFFIESQVIVATLLKLIERRVVALPIHDCLLVAKPNKSMARDLMLESFMAVVGVEGVVEEEE